MRHARSLTLTEGALPVGVFAGSNFRGLIPGTGSVQGFPATNRGAAVRAIDIATVAVAANADLTGATGAVVKTIAVAHTSTKRGVTWTHMTGTLLPTRE